MSAICGSYANPACAQEASARIKTMLDTLSHRGEDGGYLSYAFGALGQRWPARKERSLESKPLVRTWQGREYTIVYNGGLFNRGEAKAELETLGVSFTSGSDAEVLLFAYAIWGEGCLDRLLGMYAFAIYDGGRQGLFCARDRLGIKPFYYAEGEGTFYFASEPKALLAAGIKPRVDALGLWQLLYLAPVLLPGTTVFRDIYALRPAEACFVDKDGVKKWQYWSLEAKENKDSRAEATQRVKDLLTDAIVREVKTDRPLATLLSGGLDSSIVSAVAAECYRKKGDTLSTYSFEYEDNDYAPTLYQPNRDDEYAREMARYLGTEHTTLVAPNQAIADALTAATLARDLPGQADIDSSLYYFFGKIKEKHSVILSGECADEIFGGYPWFYRPEMLSRPFFPWMHDPHARIGLFDPSKVRAMEGYAHLKGVYQAAIHAVPCLDCDSAADRTARVATVLTLGYFGASLLERKDRMSMAHGVEARVPFADHRILEYLYNLPWDYKFAGGVEKSLLRDAMGDYLPATIRNRKKSPFPKTHSPQYEACIRQMLLDRLAKDGSPLASLLRPHALGELMRGDDITWLGQLMGRPQLYAWLYQMDFWLESYGIELV